jgi:hypothetical protein
MAAWLEGAVRLALDTDLNNELEEILARFKEAA